MVQYNGNHSLTEAKLLKWTGTS